MTSTEPRLTMTNRTNVVLIGMPGSGKSTVGVVLAKRLGLGFVDTDLVIQAQEGRTLQETVDTQGYPALRTAEERALLSLSVERHVVATGGSAVYSDRGMEHLTSSGVVVYLRVALPELERRVGDYSDRGIAKRPEQTFEEVYAERLALYERWAQVVIDGAGPTTEAVCRQIEAALPR